MSSKHLLKGLQRLLPQQDILTEQLDLHAYSYDNSRQRSLPDVVVFPREHDQVLDITRLCLDTQTPIVARGKGTGTTGATVPTQGGLVMSFERMNRILKTDPDNRLMVVEPGVTNADVQRQAAKHGFFWAPDPTSAEVCTVGGNLAYNSAGPRAVKYGTPRDNTLGLRVVDGNGNEFRTGVSTTKGVVGYDLTRLIIGSEGTLCLITEAILKLTPLAESKRTLSAGYTDMRAAALGVAKIMAQSVTPCALEFIDGNALALVRKRGAKIDENIGSLLMIEVDGPESCIDHAAAAVAKAADVEGVVSVRIAQNQNEIKQLWSARKQLSPALREIAPKKINEDVVVPVSRIPELVDGLALMAEKYGILIVNFGHAGNGNLHTNLLVNPDDPAQMANIEACLDEVFSLVLKLDGTISGEHGIGLVKRGFVSREIDAPALALMHSIKSQFDPQNLLNPGKCLPDPISK